jgi:hypothetical protein
MSTSLEDWERKRLQKVATMGDLSYPGHQFRALTREAGIHPERDNDLP